MDLHLQKMKNLFKKFKFNSSYDIIGDFDFFLRVSVKNIIMSIQKPLAIYRSHENNLSQKKIVSAKKKVKRGKVL